VYDSTKFLTIGAVFFICFRECLETSIIVSVLLAFLKQTLGPEHDAAVHKKLVRQVRILTSVCSGIHKKPLLFSNMA
jgi:high-affinity Fe2+/Pb2+ permease